ITQAIAERGLTEHVRLLGSRGDVPALMSRCNVFLFPSIHEGFGLVAIEANAAGLPLVGSRIPGLTEAVKDSTTAMLHDVNDFEGMAGSVVRVLTDRPDAERLAAAGRSWVKEHFSVEASARRLLDTYRPFTPRGSANGRVPQLLGEGV